MERKAENLNFYFFSEKKSPIGCQNPNLAPFMCQDALRHWDTVKVSISGIDTPSGSSETFKTKTRNENRCKNLKMERF